MSQPDNTILASAINLSQPGATVLLPAEDLTAILSEVRRQEKEIALLQENQGILFGLFAKLKDQIIPEPTEAQADRAVVLKALLAANHGKMFAKDARRQMKLPKATFSRLLTSMRTEIEVRPFHADRRKYLIILRSENG